MKHFLKQWRKFRDMTQQELGNKVGLTKASISRLETGETGYTQETLEALADALGIHPATVLSRGPTKEDRIVIQMPQSRKFRHR